MKKAFCDCCGPTYCDEFDGNCQNCGSNHLTFDSKLEMKLKSLQEKINDCDEKIIFYAYEKIKMEKEMAKLCK